MLKDNLKLLVWCITSLLPMVPLLLVYVTDKLLLISSLIFGLKKAIR